MNLQIRIIFMKIVQIVCVFPPYRGGIGNSVYNIARTLAGFGHEITVFTPDYDGRKKNKFDAPLTAPKSQFIPYLSEDSVVSGRGFNRKIFSERDIRSRQKGAGFIIRRLKPIIKIGNGALLPQLFFKLNGFDVVHLHYPFYGAVGAVLLRKLWSGKKMNLILHYHMDSRAKGLKGLIFYLYRILFLPICARLARVITCASLDYIKHSDLGSYYLLKPNKFKQTSFGVDLEQFVIYHDNLKKPSLPSLLFVGGLDKAHYFKGLENLLKALAEIIKNPEFSSTILNVIGRGDLLEYYKKCSRGLSLTKAVFFHENISDNELVDFYNRCDCLVLPSINRGEAFGLVLLEAMACAKPVITSNLPGVRSVFKKGRQGLLVKPDNVKDLVEKLKIILGDKERARDMGRAGRELVEKKYTWEKVGKRLDVIYHFVKYT